MKKLKKISALLLSCLLCLSAVGCKGNQALEYKIPEELSTVSDSIVAENDKYSLSFDDYNKCALLTDKASGYVWSTTPYEVYMEKNESLALNSAFSIEYYDLTDSSMQSDKSYNCVLDGTVETKLVDNGVCIIYYFTVAEVTIPVYYTLEDEGIRVAVKANEIVESGKTKLISISFVPYLCSTKNVQDKSAYLLVPTGSGALMYTDVEVSKASRDYQGDVYGTDASRMQLDVTENEENINCPVFGVKNADGNGLFAIIEEGAEAARINASAGSMRYGYSNAYASFYVRGYDEIEQIIGTWRSDALALSEGWSKQAVYSVCYYPLSKEKSDYSGMAEFYRNYLNEKGLLKKSELTQKSLQLEIVGGALTKKFFLGIPYEAVAALTTLENAYEIIDEAAQKTNNKMSVVLNGYGSTGISVGSVGGGYKFSSTLGNKRKHSKIEEYCTQKGISLFTDFELIYFNRSGKGFTTTFDTAKTANLQKASSYPLRINNRMPNEDAKKVNMLKRSQLDNAVEKLVKFTDNFTGVGLGQLAAVVYSDYSNESTFMKDGTEEQVVSLVNKVKENKKSVMLRSANAYAAGLSDNVTDVALDNGGYSVFDEEVPFYQMIFKGTTPLYSTPVNYSSNKQEFILKAIEFGVSPSWLVVGKHNPEVSTLNDEYLYSAEYESIKDEIYNFANENMEYYSLIADAKITNHYILNSHVTKTVFDNGITVYVNYSDEAIDIDGKSIEGMSYIYS